MKYLRSFYTLIKYFLNIHFNISFPSTPKPSQCSLSFRYPYRTLGGISFPLHTGYMPRPSYPLWFDYSNNIWWQESSEMYIRDYVQIVGREVTQLVEAPRYKSEGQGFDSQWCHRNFSLT
jgi:hypothetical protein